MNKEILIPRINREFMIRYKFKEDKAFSLVGAGQLWVVLAGEDYTAEQGEQAAEKYFKKALVADTPEVTFKLRRGLTLQFRPR